MVYGEKVVVNGGLINDLLEITHRSGPSTIPRKFNCTRDAIEAAQVIFRNPNLNEFVSKPKDLDIHVRILHLMVSHTLNHR